MPAILLDAPDTPKARVQIAKLGQFKDNRYGDFSITDKDAQQWAENLSLLPGGRAAIDLDHSAERPQPYRSTEAAGWITGIDQDGDRVMADIEWTSIGKDAITDRRYLFFSPTYGEKRTEDGVTHSNVLLGGALTNRPFLSMPMVTLASDDALARALDENPAAAFYQHALSGDLGDVARALVQLDTVTAQERRDAAKAGDALPDGSYPIRNTGELHAAAVLAASGHGDVAAAKALIRRRAKELGVDVSTLPGFGDARGSADSRRAMEVTTDTLKLLNLDDDATEQQVTDAIRALTERSEPQPRSLDDEAKANGKIVLDATTHQKLLEEHAAVESRVKTLEAERSQAQFDRSWEKAQAKGWTADEHRDRFHKLYTLDETSALDTIDNLPELINRKPVGQSYEPTVDLSDPEQRLVDQARRRLEAAGTEITEKTVAQEMRRILEGE